MLQRVEPARLRRLAAADNILTLDMTLKPLRQIRARAFAALLPVLLLWMAPADAVGYELRVSSASTMSASAVDVGISLASGNSVSALAFAIDFDDSRLRFSSTGAAPAVPNVVVDVPNGYAARSFYLTEGGSRIGIAIYDAGAPFEAIPDGRIARLRFDTLPGASGHAFVRVSTSPEPNASTAAGEIVPWTGTATSGGVTITTRRAELTTSPQTLRFGAVSAGGTIERSLLLTNTGTAPLQINDVRVNGDAAFSLASPPPSGTLAPNETRSIAIAFDAATLGSHEGFVEIDLDGSTPHRHYVPLSAEVAAEGVVVFDSRWLLPAAARLPLSQDSLWRSSLTVTNTGAHAAHLRLTLFGSAKTLGELQLELAPGATRTFQDVVKEAYDIDDASGFILIESSSPDVIARSATTNVSSEGTELGQSVPVLPWEQLLHGSEVGWLVGLQRSSTRRSNVSVINAGTNDATIRVALFGPDGTKIGERDYLVPPMLVLQGIDVFDALSADGADISASVTCLSNDCVFFAYASTVKSGSAPIFQSVR